MNYSIGIKVKEIKTGEDIMCDTDIKRLEELHDDFCTAHSMLSEAQVHGDIDDVDYWRDQCDMLIFEMKMIETSY